MMSLMSPILCIGVTNQIQHFHYSAFRHCFHVHEPEKSLSFVEEETCQQRAAEIRLDSVDLLSNGLVSVRTPEHGHTLPGTGRWLSAARCSSSASPSGPPRWRCRAPEGPQTFWFPFKLLLLISAAAQRSTANSNICFLSLSKLVWLLVEDYFRCSHFVNSPSETRTQTRGFRSPFSSRTYCH